MTDEHHPDAVRAIVTPFTNIMTYLHANMWTILP